MLTINNLSVSYGNKVVLSKLSFHADHQMIHGVVGYNGAGKTTLLNAIYGIPRKFEEIKMDGTILGRSSVSYLDSGQYFYPYISGRDYLKMFSARNPSFEYESLCRLFNVPIDNFVDTYSDGMKKKLAIVATLALKKDVIMMDEPFNGLDLESVFLLQLALKSIASKGNTVIITSHIMESLIPLCDTISVLKDGIISKTYASSEYASLKEEMHGRLESEYGSVVEKIL